MVIPVRTSSPPLTEKEHESEWRSLHWPVDEIFMAWNYACYVNTVAAAGKAQYNLPMYVNAWLQQRDHAWPGTYPSGGPVPQVHDIWRAGAPAIDILAPDLYVPEFEELCERFTRSVNPLFIPESQAGAWGVANAIWAFGTQNAIGYSPFGIDRLASSDMELAHAYDFLSQISPLILANQGKGSMTAVLLDSTNAIQKVQLGNYFIEAHFMSRPSGSGSTNMYPEKVAGLFISTGPDSYIIAGRNLTVYFTSATNELEKVGLATVEEGVYQDGRWVPGRRLNGDETPEWKALRFRSDNYSIQHVKLYRYR
jgi:beta-galactosidase GanA